MCEALEKRGKVLKMCEKNCNTVSFSVECTHARIRHAVIMNEITVNDQALSHRLLMDDKDCKTL